MTKSPNIRATFFALFTSMVIVTAIPGIVMPIL